MPDLKCFYHFKPWRGEGRQDHHVLPAEKRVKHQVSRRSRDRVHDAASRTENWPRC